MDMGEEKKETNLEGQRDNVEEHNSNGPEIEEKEKISSQMEEKEDSLKEEKSVNIWKIATTAISVLLIVSIFTNGFGITGMVTKDTTESEEDTSADVISAEEAADKAVKFINENLLQPGTTAEFKGVEEKGNLYSVKLTVGGQDFSSFVTKDGSLLFPNSIDLNEAPEVETPPEPPEPEEVTKSDKPTVELFVMSHCPFGTQAEKGMIPVIELLSAKADFKIRWVNYAMHGEKEVREQLRQECIKTEQNDKFIPYLKCFLKDGESKPCLEEKGIDKAKLEACEKAKDEEFKLTETLENQESWGSRFPPFPIHDEENKKYGVRGSPTLVINGEVVSSSRSPAAYLATICGAFNEAPEECSEELSAANPSAGFGYEETGSDSTASCG